MAAGEWEDWSPQAHKAQKTADENRELLKKLGRDPELDPELKVLRRVCDGHDNRCFWAEEVAERLAQDGY